MILSTLLFSLVTSITVPCVGDVTDALQQASGQQINLTAGDCSLHAPVEFCDPTDLVGAGETRTKIYTVTGMTGISFLRGVRCVGRGKGASQSIIRDLSIIAPGVVFTSTPTFGLEIRASMTVERVAIQGFVHAFDVYGNVQKDGTHANRVDLHRLSATGAMHAGFWIQGPDVNVSTIVGLAAQSNCREASKWNRYFDAKRSVEEGGRYQSDVCAGYFNRAQFGTFDAAISGANNYDRIAGKQYPAQWYEGPQNTSVCLGCYREGTDATVPPSHFDNYNIALGGFVHFTGSGLQLSGFRVNRLEIANASDPLYPVTLKLGDLAGARTFMRFDGSGALPGGVKMTSLSLKLDPLRLTFVWDLNNQVRATWIDLRSGVAGMKAQ